MGSPLLIKAHFPPLKHSPKHKHGKPWARSKGTRERERKKEIKKDRQNEDKIQIDRKNRQRERERERDRVSCVFRCMHACICESVHELKDSQSEAGMREKQPDSDG